MRRLPRVRPACPLPQHHRHREQLAAVQVVYLHHRQPGCRMPRSAASPRASAPARALPGQATLHDFHGCLHTGQLARVRLAGRPHLADTGGRGGHPWAVAQSTIPQTWRATFTARSAADATTHARTSEDQAPGYQRRTQAAAGPGPTERARARAARPPERRTPAVRWSSPCGRVRAVLWARVFSLGNRQDHHVWYKKELKTRALSMAAHKSMHQLVTQPDCGHSANL